MEIKQGYVVIADMVGFSEEVPRRQAELVAEFVTVLSDAVAAALDGLQVNIFSTGDGAIISVYGRDVEETASIAPRVLDLAVDLLRRTLAASYELKVSINASGHEALIDVTAVPTLHANVIQIGNGINVAERILNFAEPMEIVVSEQFREALANSGDNRSGRFFSQSVFVKHMRNLMLHVYNPPHEEKGFVGQPREARNRRHKRYAYFPPMKQQTLDRFRDVGLETDVLETVEYVYETIAAVNSGYKFISWAAVEDVLVAARPRADEEVLAFSRSDYEGHFWTTPAAEIYLRRLSSSFNQKRLIIYSTASPDMVLAPDPVLHGLRQLHADGSLRKLDAAHARRHRLYRFRFGATIYPERGCIIAPIPAPASYDEYLDIVKFTQDPWRVFDRFAERDFRSTEFKAFVVAEESLVAEFVDEFRDLFDDEDAESLHDR
jgi:class 3 adenylate cyclase